uniref:Cytochrome P450 n=1 Tax=Agasicles hygrophila TaxID=715812 RepID=A0A3S5FUG5_9CUCU|nr:cytochrome P450 [Agasicles hygrophila]
MLEWLLLALVVIIFCYVYGAKPLNYWRSRGVKQGNPKWFAGDNWKALFRMENFTDMVIRLYNESPGARYYGSYQFSTPTLLIKDPELIKLITVKDFDHFLDHRTFVPENADPLLAKNLFALKGEKWRDMRPILSPSFTSSKMKAIFILMSDCAKDFCDFFLKKNKDIVEVELKDIFTRYTNDVIATTAFGIKVNSLENPENEFYMMGKSATDFSSWRKSLKFFGYFLFPKLFEFFKVKFFDSNVSSFFYELVENTIRTRQEKGIVRPDMIHLLMEAQKMGSQRKEEEKEAMDKNMLNEKPPSYSKELTTLDITAQALIFFFAGFDSVATAMSFMGYELAANPDIQKRLRKEIVDALKESDGNVTYDILHKMKYMDMVVSETLRKWPNAVLTDRVCTKPYTIEAATPEEKPLLIEKGVVIAIPVVGIHRDPNVYPDPERFDPERFNEENKSCIDPYKYLPFGLGPRNCIGNRFALMEMKVISFYMLLNFEIVPISKSRIPLKLSKKQINMAPEGGFWFGLKRIQQ